MVRKTVVPGGVDPPDLLPHGQPRGRVEARGGLVEEEHLGGVHEGAGQVEPALHPARVGLRAPVGGVAQAHELEQLFVRAGTSAPLIP